VIRSGRCFTVLPSLLRVNGAKTTGHEKAALDGPTDLNDGPTHPIACGQRAVGAVSEPIVFISHHRIKPGRAEEVKALTTEIWSAVGVACPRC
jgi:hypothetical protein